MVLVRVLSLFCKGDGCVGLAGLDETVGAEIVCVEKSVFVCCSIDVEELEVVCLVGRSYDVGGSSRSATYTPVSLNGSSFFTSTSGSIVCVDLGIEAFRSRGGGMVCVCTANCSWDGSGSKSSVCVVWLCIGGGVCVHTSISVGNPPPMKKSSECLNRVDRRGGDTGADVTGMGCGSGSCCCISTFGEGGAGISICASSISGSVSVDISWWVGSGVGSGSGIDCTSGPAAGCGCGSGSGSGSDVYGGGGGGRDS